MPYVIVYQLDGRPTEVKRRLVEGITEVVSRVLEIPASDSTRRYLKTKKEKLGHLM